jgi:hypothetical protein
LLEQNLDKIDWDYLILNTNPNSIYLLEQNLDNVDWDYLSHKANSNATHLLAKLDYKQLRLDNQEFVKDLVTFVCHPIWIQKCASKMGLDFDEYQELLCNCNVI